MASEDGADDGLKVECLVWPVVDHFDPCCFFHNMV